MTTRRSGVRPETCSVEPVGFMSPEEDRSEASGACLFFAAYRAASAHGSTTGSQAAVRVLKCETSAVAATSAAIDGETLASTETRRSETRARGVGSTRRPSSPPLLTPRSSTYSVASTRSIAAVATVPGGGVEVESAFESAV